MGLLDKRAEFWYLKVGRRRLLLAGLGIIVDSIDEGTQLLDIKFLLLVLILLLSLTLLAALMASRRYLRLRLIRVNHHHLLLELGLLLLFLALRIDRRCRLHVAVLIQIEEQVSERSVVLQASELRRAAVR